MTHSFYEGKKFLHPFEGETEPIDPEEGRKHGKYTWSKSPRYDVPGLGYVPLEVGPLARQLIAGNPDHAAHQNYDPLIYNCYKQMGPSVMLRAFARMHEAAKYYKWTRQWLTELKLHDRFYIKPVERAEGQGFGATEAARGFLADWIVLKEGKIANYQVITPTAWNVCPRDGQENRGPMETAFMGTKVADTEDPVELGHVARSFDSCLVCTVHAYDGKSGAELAEFQLNGNGAC